jgi:phosphatidylglycerol---prolipoprotein diacylglyceryl transferase
MYPVLFKIGVLPVHAYGFMLALGFLAGILVSLYFARRVAVRPETILDLALYVIISALVGARLFYVIGRWPEYRENLLEIVMVQNGGLAFLGGLLLALAVVFCYARRKNLPVLRLFDVMAPGMALGYAITRIGCFLNGCCFGVPTRLPWGIAFPPGSLAYAQFPGEHTHPTQLYALFLMLVIFFVTLYLWKSRKYDGYIFFWTLILYALYRFAVEFFRYCPSELYRLGLNPGQIISLTLFAAGAAGLLLNSRRKSSLPGA